MGKSLGDSGPDAAWVWESVLVVVCVLSSVFLVEGLRPLAFEAVALDTGFRLAALGVAVFFGVLDELLEDEEEDLRVVIRPDSLQWVTATGQSV